MGVEESTSVVRLVSLLGIWRSNLAHGFATVTRRVMGLASGAPP
jgi:hypothetical protein